jgi:hypothetical protein
VDRTTNASSPRIQRASSNERTKTPCGSQLAPRCAASRQPRSSKNSTVPSRSCCSSREWYCAAKRASLTIIRQPAQASWPRSGSAATGGHTADRLHAVSIIISSAATTTKARLVSDPE